MRTIFLLSATLVVLAACSESAQPPQTKQEAAQPVVSQAPNKLTSIAVPAGEYRLDPNHASLSFSVSHLGLSNYQMRFTDYQVKADIHPDNLSASSVTVMVNPASIRTDFSGDYKASHKDSPYSSWEEDLIQSPKFLNAGEHPTITYQSTSVTPTDFGTLRINGELTLLGSTKPVTLEAKLVGAAEQHPFMGMGALGFTATGSFKRSDFGMTHLLEPPLIGDTVTLEFDGELHQVVNSTAQSAD